MARIPRLVTLQDALGEHGGRQGRLAATDQQSGTAATFSVIATTAPADPATADLVRTLRVYTIPQATQGTNLHAYVGGTTASYVDLADAISAKLAARDRRRDPAELLHPADRLPLLHLRHPGRRREHPVRDSLVRRAHRRLPEGLGPEPRRSRHRERHQSDRELRPADDVHRAVRALDGLPGLPDRARSSSTGRGRNRPRGDPARPHGGSARHRRRGADHDRGLRQLRPQRRSRR